MILNLLKLALMFWVDPLYPLMHLWLVVEVMIDLMMLYNLGMLVCQLILCGAHLVSLIGHRERRNLL